MSGSIASSFLSPNELLAPREHWRQQQQTDAYTQNVALQAQKQDRELELSDQAQIANTAGYLLSLPSEDARSAAWGKIYGTLPGHVQARAPATYQGEEWLRGVQARAVPAKEQWERQQNSSANAALLGGGAGGAGGAGSAGGAPGVADPATAYGAGGPGASAQVPAAYMPFFEEASKKYGIPVDRLIAQARQESGFNAGAIGGAGEIGVMQIHPKTAAAPGFGVDPVDAASLRDPRTNILFGAAYLKGRMGGADANDPVAWQRGLRSYNGGGDPNYVANVTRYLPAGGGSVAPPPPSVAPMASGGASGGAPPGGGVAGRIPGAVDVAGPGAPPNALTAPPGVVAPPAPPASVESAPAPAAPAAPMAPVAASREQLAAKLGIGPNGLTQRDVAEFTAIQNTTPPAQFAQQVEARRQHNLAQVQQLQADQRQAVVDAHQAQRDRATDSTRGLPPGYERDASGKVVKIEGLPETPLVGGTGTDNIAMNTLLTLADAMENGTATKAQRRQYALMHEHLSADHVVEIPDPNDPAKTVKATIPGKKLDYLPRPPPIEAAGGAGGAGGPRLPEVIPGTSETKPLTAEQGKAGGFADRMHADNQVMNDLDARAASWTERRGEQIGGFIGYSLNSPGFERVKQAQEDFLNAVLRYESGAAIGPDEFRKGAKQYFPQPGESEAVIEQKRVARQREIDAMMRQAGPGYKAPSIAAGKAAKDKPPADALPPGFKEIK
jgi:hypothetical protein